MDVFVSRMGWRELRHGWLRWLFLVGCVAAGVGGLIAVRSVSDLLETEIRYEARNLAAADVIVASNRPFSEPTQTVLTKLVREEGVVLARSTRFTGMARSSNETSSGETSNGDAPSSDASSSDASSSDTSSSDTSSSDTSSSDTSSSRDSDRETRSDADPAIERVRLVEVRAVSGTFPFYGAVETGSGRPLWELLKDNTTLVSPELLLHLALDLGDSIRLGRANFTIVDTVLREPDGALSTFQVGPRVLLNEAGGAATGLILPTSRVRYKALLKLPERQDAEDLAADLKEALPRRYATIETFSEAQPSVQRFLTQLSSYLRLLALAALLLGGLGLAEATQLYMIQRLDRIALLKTAGATHRQLLQIYLGQLLLMSLIGVALGTGAAWVIQGILLETLADFLPVTVTNRLSAAGIAEGLALGLAASFWFALPPLLRALQTPPLHVLRRLTNATRTFAPLWDWLRVALGLSLGTLIAVWQAESWKLGGIFVLGLVGTWIVLRLLTAFLLRALRKLPLQGAPFVLRQALSGLHRPGNRSVLVISTLSLGLLMLLSIYQIRSHLLAQLSFSTRPDQHNLFFIDIQPQQRQTIEKLLASYVANPEEPEALRFIPLIRGRILKLDGVDFNPDDPKLDEEAKRALSYEYPFTYRDHLEETETLVEGKFGIDPSIDGPQISLSRWWSGEVGLGVGQQVTLDVQGVPITASITSIRHIDWSQGPGFSFVFMPGTLEDAPQIFLATVRVEEEDARVSLQQTIARRFPNVSALDVQPVLRFVANLLQRIALSVQVTAFFSLACGLVILVGTIAGGKFYRVRETALLKALGMSTNKLMLLFGVEYAILGCLTALIGIGGSIVLSLALVQFVFQGEWYWDPGFYLLAWGGAILSVIFVGIGSNLDVIRARPLATLNQEN